MRQKNILAISFLIVAILVLVTFMLPSMSASFWDWLTGKATQPTNVSIAVSSITIPWVSAIDSPQNVTENNKITIQFFFNASIPGGVAANINNSTASANFTLAGESTRINSSCINVSGGDDWTNFSCSIDVWYWDGAGNWTVNTYIADNNGNGVINSSTNMTLSSSTCFDISPDTLTWASTIPGSTNQTSNNDPTLLNNTCNEDIAANDIAVKALDLVGNTNADYKINSTNFTADIETGGSCSGATCVECDGVALSNATYVNVTGASLPSGNNSLSYGNTTSGQEQLYYCLVTVDSGLITQTYSTNTYGSWTIEIS